MQWIEAVLLGEVALILAVVAVALVGLLFLTGRLAAKRAAQVVLGCAVVFGAPAIALGLMDATGQGVAPAPLPMVQQSHSSGREGLPPPQQGSGASLRRD